MSDLSTQLVPTEESEVVRHFKQAIAGGKHWYLALLEAIGLWSKAEEAYDGRIYRYLIAGEAFDWMLLAERLCAAVNGLLPSDETAAFLFHGKPPINLPADKFKGLIGGSKYHQYLNYFYGITVEEALIQAVQEEVRKEKRALGCNNEGDTINEAYRRIYGATRAVLLRRFRREKGYPHMRSISLAELKEFTYWLFRYRLRQCDKAKIASDTKKALHRLKSY